MSQHNLQAGQDLLPDLCDDFPELVQIVQPMFMTYGGRPTFSGEIVTVKTCEDNSRVKELLAEPGHGRVLVVDGAGSLRKALLGDMIAESAVQQGWSGVVLYGAVRDVHALGQLDLGVQALGAFPVRTARQGLGEVNVPVTFGGVTFSPGQFLYADRNGILVAPHALR
ncbi:ribonuclease E activity regulator RraA [Salinispirillum marinum]|uniref:4-hydroxy-4-methyl-2-oxoglutarate aldolase n=2 Tax=Saccharospirillaceae TaxID=255527 RepID=A0ABV8BGL9_9GAMM